MVPQCRQESILLRALKYSFLILSIAFSACQPAENIHIGGVAFNPTLRPDTQPVSDSDRTGYSTYSSGLPVPGSAERRIVSELYPVPPGFVEGTALEQFLRKLRRSRFYWAAPNETMRLSWEVVGRDVRIEGVTCNISNVGACELREPESRVLLECDGQTFSTVPWERATQLNVTLQICGRTAGPNPFNLPQEYDQNCSNLDNPCAFSASNPQHGYYPFCQFNCPLEAYTGTYSLVIATPQSEVHRKRLVPTIRRVPYSVDIARRVTVTESEQGFNFSWSVKGFDGQELAPPTPAESLWEENFSPGLLNSRIRIFVEDAAAPGGKRYLNPTSLTVDSELNRIALCDPDPGLSEFSPRNCPILTRSNPAYQLQEEEKRLQWTVSASRNQSGQPEVQAEDPVFIEFTIASTSGGTGALFVDPALVDLGEISHERESRFSNRLRIGNSGNHAVTIQRVDWISRNAFGTSGAFELEFPGGRALPFQMFAGTEVPLTIISRPAGSDELLSYAVFVFEDATGANRTVAVPITAKAYAPSVFLTPSSPVAFNTGPQKFRGVSVVNDGYTSAEILGAHIRGADASSFHIRRAPASYPFALAPGDIEVYRIEYEPVFSFSVFPPPAEFTHRATLAVQTTAGEQSLELQGTARFEATRPGRRRMTVTLKPR